MTQPKTRLKGANRRSLRSPWLGLSRIAHSAGVSVSATRPDRITATAIVTANWR